MNNFFKKYNMQVFKSVTLILFFSYSTVMAQNVEDYFTSNVLEFQPKTPEAAALDNFLSVPVDYYTGRPNVNIPICNIPVNDLEINLSLSYTSNGIKVESTPGPVGEGWVLNGLPYISRTVIGLPDEDPVLGLWKSISEFNIPNPNNSVSTFRNYVLSFAQKKNICDYGWDLQPDLYTYSINGKSGQFYIDPYSKQPVIIPDDAIKIVSTFNDETNPTEIIKWEIKDLNGVVYEFEPSTRLWPVANNNQLPLLDYRIPHEYISDWTIYSITSRITNTFILFNKSGSISSKENKIETSEHWHQISECPGVTENDYINTTSYQICNSSAINSITACTGIQVFLNYDERSDYENDPEEHPYSGGIINYSSRKLSSIEIWNNGESRYKYNLFYDYFSGSKRLCLRKIDLVNLILNEEDIIETYQFGYYYPNYVPSKNTKGQDFWGFYNGNESNSSLMLGYTDRYNYYNSGADRFPDLSEDKKFAKAGMLKTIIYPTGGRVDFEYEPHEYSKVGAAYVSNLTGHLNLPSNSEIERKAAFAAIPAGEDYEGQITNYSKSFCVEVQTTFYFDIDLGSIGDDVQAHILKQSGIDSWGIIKTFGPGVSYNNYSYTLEPGTYKLQINNFASIWDDGDKYTLTNRVWIETEYEVQCINAVNPEEVNTLQAGGVRLSRVELNPLGSTTPKIIKTYSYRTTLEEGDLSSGVLVTDIPPYQYRKDFEVPVDDGLKFPYICYGSYLIRFSHGFGNYGISGGSHIGYSRVIETIRDENNNSLGSTEYKFYTSADYPMLLLIGYPHAITDISDDWKRGVMIEKNVYSTSSNPISTTTYEYVLDDENSNPKVPGISVKWEYRSCVDESDETLNYISQLNYLRGTGFKGLITKTEVNPEGIETETEYDYNDTNLLVKEITRHNINNNDVYRTLIKYPTDYDISPTGMVEFYDDDQNLLGNHMIGIPVEKIDFVNSVNFGIDPRTSDPTNKIVSAISKEFSDTYPGLVKNIYELAVEVPMLPTEAPGDDYFYAGEENYYLTAHYEYNSYKLPVYIVGKDKIPKSFLWNRPLNNWSFDRNKPSAVIENCILPSATGSINFLYEDFEDTDQYTYGGRFSKIGEYHHSLGSTDWEVTMSAGSYNLEYWWKGSSNPLIPWQHHKEILEEQFDEYGSSLPIQITIPASTVTLVDDIRIYPYNAQMTSYSYNNLYGVLAKTDANGQTTQYYYDVLGRLGFIRDVNKDVIEQISYNYQTTEFSISPQQITVGPADGDYEFILKCSSSWSIEVDSDDSYWITISSPTTGTENAICTFEVDELLSASEREGEIIVTCLSTTETRIFRITQHGGNISLSKSSLHFNHDNIAQSVTITSDAAWNIVNKPDWITVIPSSGSGSENLLVSAESYTSYIHDRFGTIKFSNGINSCYLNVTQEKRRLNVNYTMADICWQWWAETRTFIVDANIDWYVSEVYSPEGMFEARKVSNRLEIESASNNSYSYYSGYVRISAYDDSFYVQISPLRKSAICTGRQSFDVDYCGCYDDGSGPGPIDYPSFPTE